jgi:RNA polymerase sigma-70 factor, ECF subfamily
VKENEDNLIKQAQDGIISAWEKLVSLYMRDAYNFCLKLTNGNHNDAEDISQLAFIKVYQNLRNFRGEAPFKNWFYKIMTNLYINQCNKKKPVLASEIIDDDIENITDFKVNDNAQSILSKEASEMLMNKIGLLPPRQKIVLIMHTYEGMSIKEIADTIGVSYEAVKMNLSFARRRLLRELKGCL